jgi:hypothetical protein
MPGEPDWFDVYRLEAIEIETATGVQSPSNIIDWGENFFLRAHFNGSDHQWTNMTANGFEYRVQFYIKGMKPGVADPAALADVTGNLVAGQLDYQVDSATTSIAAENIYRCGVMVTFRTSGGGHWYGVLGHNEDCVIQISAEEEFG